MVSISDELFASLQGMFYLHSVNQTGIWQEGLLSIEDMRYQITGVQIDKHPTPKAYTETE